MSDRFYIQAPAGKAKSGRFCWWTVKDSKRDLREHGNNITDYIYDGYPDAQQQAEKRAAELNANPSLLRRYGVNHPDSNEEFLRLYAAA
jgi:hypothetical protein